MAGFSACIYGTAKAFAVVAQTTAGAPDTKTLDVELLRAGAKVPTDVINCADTAYMTIPLDAKATSVVKQFDGTLVFRFNKKSTGPFPVLRFEAVQDAGNLICKEVSSSTGCRLVVKIPNTQLQMIEKAGGFAIQ